MSDIYLRYIGKGKGTLIGVPAKNMTYTEAHQYNVENLVNSGLYEIVKTKVNLDNLVEEIKSNRTYKRKE